MIKKTKYYYLITVMFAVFSFCSLKAEQRDVKILKDIEDEAVVETKPFMDYVQD